MSPKRCGFAIVMASVAGGLVGCGAAHPSKAVTAEPANVVSGPPSRYDAIDIATPAGHDSSVPSGLRAGLAPLLTARDFGPEANLADYGLDHPEGVIIYRRGDAVVARVSIGTTNFDRTGFYAMLQGDPAVDLVLADAIRPVLALVGVEVAPPG
jgi:hypothetical protein